MPKSRRPRSNRGGSRSSSRASTQTASRASRRAAGGDTPEAARQEHSEGTEDFTLASLSLDQLLECIRTEVRAECQAQQLPPPVSQPHLAPLVAPTQSLPGNNG